MIQLILHSPDPKVDPLLASALRPECSVIPEPNKDKLKRIVASGQADVVIIDFDQNYSSLDEQLAFCNEIGDSRTPIVVMTDDLKRSTAIEFLQRGAFDCIRKPPSLIELKVVIRRAYEHSLMKRELEQARRAAPPTPCCDQLVGSSGKAQVVYDLIRRVADLNVFVLIMGESGTGKELVARAIHNLGKRAEEPFIAVSCGAIPETLIEAELFGHEKGAFTGSTGSRTGCLEQAGGGTLFLDEIGELSLNTQVKLLRVLQQKEFTRLGGNRPIPLNARVLFATHRNLEQMVEQGSFRRDLFFRVNVMRLQVPPLRERTEDIPVLARHFLNQYAAEYDKPVSDIRPNAMELLVDYAWPGNTRELENAIQGAVILADGGSITPADLPESIQELDEGAGIGEAESGEPGESGSASFDDLLRQFKIGVANEAIMACNGNKTHAARRLRVSRTYLHRLLRLGPEKDDNRSEAAAVQSIDAA
jgi:DNA-binding NtrC family response regulator